ncbi:MAG TPA: CopG family transcriptional regulator, partial [Acidimicrobiales bacterium]|nr:CopG family transcriptional regulator [Acidimicrobiales bacterium]
MQRTNIYLDADQAKALDRLAAGEGRTRSDLIRELIDRALSGGDDDLDGDLRAIDDSFGAMRDAEAAARGRDERSEHLDRMWRIGT